MIRTQLPIPPSNYESQVRLPGAAFLTNTPHPTSSDWKNHNHWTKIHSYLYQQLRGVCMYCASFTPRRRNPTLVDHTSIDHFVPKSRNYPLAFEWTNFRLCRARLNENKKNFEDVLDPCAIQTGWFRLSFTTFLLSPDPALSVELRQQIDATISRLQLNLDDAYPAERARVTYSYADNKLPFSDVADRYPFIAAEMLAQNFDVNFLPLFKTVLAMPKMRGALVRQGWHA